MAILGIYKIVRLDTTDLYVGSSQDIQGRWYRHRRALRLGQHASPKLQSAWTKYGESAFAFSVIEECGKEELLAREQHYLDTWHPTFNCALYAGAPMRGRKQSSEQIESARLSMVGNTHRLGSKHSAERKRQMSEFMKARVPARGWRHSESAKQRISAAMLGKRNRLGTKHSAETRAKMSASHRNQLATGSI